MLTHHFDTCRGLLLLLTLLSPAVPLAAQVTDAGVESPYVNLTVEPRASLKWDAVALHVDASLGAWVTVFARAVVPVGLSDPGPYEDLISQYPWLEDVPWTPGSLNLALAVSEIPPETAFSTEVPLIDPQAIASHWSSVVQADGAELIRTRAQPVLGSTPSGALYRRPWTVDCSAWDYALTGSAQPMRELWSPRLAGVELGYDDTNGTWFSNERVLTECIIAQAGSFEAAQEFIEHSGGMEHAVSLGLSIVYQAVAYEDHLGPPFPWYSDFTDVTVPGLPGLAVAAPVPRPPTPRLSGARLVRPTVGSPVSGSSPPGPQPIDEILYGPTATVNGDLVMPLHGMAGPFSCVIKWGTRTRSIPGRFAATGSVRFPLPALVPVGATIQILSVTNAWGTTSGAGMPWEWVLVGP